MLSSSSLYIVGEEKPGKLIESMDDFDASTKEKLLANNALEFLGLDKDKFVDEWMTTASVFCGREAADDM